VIQVIKRRCILIKSFVAEENELNPDDGSIQIVLKKDHDKICLINPQLDKLMDVISVKRNPPTVGTENK